MINLGFWEKIKRPIMVIAPMSGVTDEAFRLMFLKYGRPDVFWTEFVSAEGLFSRGEKVCRKILDFDKKEKPIVAQLFGSEPKYFEKASALVAELGFNGIDINMGCPDRGIEKQGGGAVLIKSPKLAKEIIRAAKKGADKIPVSVKTRIGYDKNEIAEWIPTILEENIAVLTVHFRAKKETYGVPAKWELAEEIVKLRDKYASKTLIFGNGDVKSLAEAHKLADENGLDGIMIGRSVIGNPWLFSGRVPEIAERLNAIIEHAKFFDSCHKEEVNNINYYKKFESLKKHFHGQVNGFRGAKELRDQLMKVKSTNETKLVIEKFIKNYERHP